MQIVGTVALILTLYVYYRILTQMQLQSGTIQEQLQAVKHQVEVARSASVAENTLSVINYLQSPDIQAARRTVLQKLEPENYSSWGKIAEYHRAASEVIASYDMAAIIMRLGIVHDEVFLNNWGPSIEGCFKKCKPLMDDLRRPEKRGPAYWANFIWLHDQIVQRKNETAQAAS